MAEKTHTVPTCDCGHALGDHRVVSAGLRNRYGICLAKGCSCREFSERKGT